MKSFVVVVDMQGDFINADGALPVAGADALLAPMTEWLRALQPDETAGVLFTADTHEPDIYARSEEAKQFPPHCMRGTPGWALLIDPAVIDPVIPCYRLEKGVFDMWAEPGIMIERLDGDAPPVPREDFFARLKQDGVEHVRVIGVAADFCVRWAAKGLIEHGFKVTIPPALTRGIKRQIDAVIADEWGRTEVAIA
ncbi:cysteine hydrolase [Sphingomonas sp. So64.6b]|uniref:cysteine hydrolase family protein n=1 Tax=Sphingomonas sp. So64.6b TaxID=2997354 RepID=UPI001600DF8B|nr:isochorismatase family cysteine hydrolase [Sphingomonas sp. So64.6b]QNA82858.1 cysteine hydrolase [Sphingomonas sp. So64.6b]